jgi:hypothetical protein
MHPSGVECIDIVRHENFNIVNAIKYIWRRQEKGNEVEDLQKAIYYLQCEVDLVVKKKIFGSKTVHYADLE